MVLDLLQGLLLIVDVKGVVRHQLERYLQQPLLCILDSVLVSSVLGNLRGQITVFAVPSSSDNVPALLEVFHFRNDGGVPFRELFSFFVDGLQVVFLLFNVVYNVFGTL
uniref:Uncharacterized protein n=1 Tax=Cacopsylla melanoneura TaxID=428564 RepID=A0A8D8TZE0_9HEMI